MAVTLDAGYVPQTKEQLLTIMFDFTNGILVDLNKPTMLYQEWLGTNFHKMSLTPVNLTMRTESQCLNIINNFFKFLSDSLFKIQSSSGPTLAGLAIIVEKHAPGVQYYVRYNEKIVSSTEIYGGDITLSFDSPTWDSDDVNDPAAIAIFREGMPIGTVATAIDASKKTVVVPVVDNTQTATYSYRVLLPEDYTVLALQINVQLKRASQAGQLQTSPTLATLSADIKAKMSYRISIGKDFDPDSLLDPSDYPGVADFIIKSKLTADTDWVTGRREITDPDFCQKFVAGAISLQLV